MTRWRSRNRPKSNCAATAARVDALLGVVRPLSGVMAYAIHRPIAVIVPGLEILPKTGRRIGLNMTRI